MGKYISIEYKNLKIEPQEITQGQLVDTTIAGYEAKRWEGTGYFDIIMNAFDKNIQAQAESGRIVGQNYATAYVQLIQIAIEKAIDIVKANEDITLKAAELELKEAIADLDLGVKKDELELKKELAKQDKELKVLEQEVKRAQIHVLDRQAEGFSTNLLIKLLEAQQGNFAMMFSSGMLEFKEGDTEAFPKSIQASELDDIYKLVKEKAKEDWEKANSAKYTVEERIKRGGETSGIVL